MKKLRIQTPKPTEFSRFCISKTIWECRLTTKTTIMIFFVLSTRDSCPGYQCCGSGSESGSTGSTCFRPHGSGSISHRYRSGSGSEFFYHQAKIVRKTLIPTACFVTSFWLFIFENDVNVPSKSNKQKNFFFKISFLLVSWRCMTKTAGSRSGSGSTPKCHGSATLLATLPYSFGGGLGKLTLVIDY